MHCANWTASWTTALFFWRLLDITIFSTGGRRCCLWRQLSSWYLQQFGMTKYRKGPTKDRKGPQRTHKRPTKDRKGALRAKLQEIDTN